VAHGTKAIAAAPATRRRTPRARGRPRTIVNGARSVPEPQRRSSARYTPDSPDGDRRASSSTARHVKTRIRLRPRAFREVVKASHEPETVPTLGDVTAVGALDGQERVDFEHIGRGCDSARRPARVRRRPWRPGALAAPMIPPPARRELLAPHRGRRPRPEGEARRARGRRWRWDSRGHDRGAAFTGRTSRRDTRRTGRCARDRGGCTRGCSAKTRCGRAHRLPSAADRCGDPRPRSSPCGVSGEFPEATGRVSASRQRGLRVRGQSSVGPPGKAYECGRSATRRPSRRRLSRSNASDSGHPIPPVHGRQAGEGSLAVTLEARRCAEARGRMCWLGEVTGA